MQKNRYKTKHKATHPSAKQRRNKKMLYGGEMDLRCVVLVRSQKRSQK